MWSAGAGEDAIVRACDPTRKYASYAGRVDLAQLWQLLADARVLVAPDTGVAHLGRVVAVPTVALFGPGSALICGAGDFWRDMPYRAVTVDPFPCLEDLPAGYWPIVLTFRGLGVDAGIHLDEKGQPYALVEMSPSWSLTASHA